MSWLIGRVQVNGDQLRFLLAAFVSLDHSLGQRCGHRQQICSSDTVSNRDSVRLRGQIIAGFEQQGTTLRTGMCLVGQLQLVDSAIKAIKIGSGSEPLSAELNARTRSLSIRRSSVVSTLSNSVKMMGELGIETTEYRQLLLETGGGDY